MNCIKCIILFVIFVSVTNADDYRVSTQEGMVNIPIPTGISGLDPSLDGQTWWRGVSGPFEVISLDNNNGKLIEGKINELKAKVLAKWGLPDVDITVPVRIMVVPDKEMLNKLFRIELSRVEPFREYKGSNMHVVYISSKDSLEDTINPFLTEIMIEEFKKRNNLSLPFWISRGMSNSSLSPNEIRKLFKNKRPTSISDMFSMDVAKWRKMDTSKKAEFDSQCVAVCFLLRKEFGEINLHNFLQSGARSHGVTNVYKFRDVNEFELSYQRFSEDMANALRQNKVPDSYLTISRKR